MSKNYRRLRLAALLAGAGATGPLAAQTVPQPAVERVLTVLGNYSIGGQVTPTGCTPAQVQGIMFNEAQGFSVSRALEEASYGRDLVHGDVIGPRTVVADAWDRNFNGVIDCQSYPLLSNALRQQLQAEGVDLASYQRYVWVLPGAAGCSSSGGDHYVNGLTNLAGNEHWIFVCNQEGTYLHEIGHDRLNVGTHPNDSEDPLGANAGQLRFFNAPGSLVLNYMPAESVQVLRQSGEYSIAPMELVPESVALPQVYQFTAGGLTYDLSYRQPIGVDRRLGTVLRHLSINDHNSRDTAGSISPTLTTTTLGGVTLQYVSHSSSAFRFRITFPASSSNPAPTPTRRSFTIGAENAGAITVSALNLQAGDSVSWNYGDGISGPQDFGPNADYQYLSNGPKIISMSVNGTLVERRGVVIRNAPPLCAPSDTVLCLRNRRIKVELTWKNQHSPGQTGPGHAVPLAGSDETGLFWFFNSSNLELAVKVLDPDSDPNTGDFWVFYGGLTDLEYDLTVTEMLWPYRTETYHNAPGQTCGGADVVLGSTAGNATPGTPVVGTAGTTSPGTCTANATTHCLAGGRVKVEAFYGTANTPAGKIPLTANAGAFYFGSASNLELLAKALGPNNNSFLVFYGALSNQRYTVKFTDVVTGRTRTFVNPQGNYCGSNGVL